MIVAMVMLAAIFIASPVLAAGSRYPIEVVKRTPTVISLTGKIVEDGGTKIDVAIQMTNKAFREFRLTTQTIDISDALCLEWTSEGKSQSFDCDDLAKYNTVAIIAKVSKTDSGEVTFTARRVQKSQLRIRIP